MRSWSPILLVVIIIGGCLGQENGPSSDRGAGDQPKNPDAKDGFVILPVPEVRPQPPVRGPGTKENQGNAGENPAPPQAPIDPIAADIYRRRLRIATLFRKKYSF